MTVNGLSVQCLVNIHLMYFCFQFALFLSILLSFAEARPQKKTKSTIQPQSLSSSERHHKLKKKILNPSEKASAQKSNGKLFTGWQKGNDKTGSRYYLVKANSNGADVIQYFVYLAPGRPLAGGPRMDRRAVTSPGVVKISRLASRLRR